MDDANVGSLMGAQLACMEIRHECARFVMCLTLGWRVGDGDRLIQRERSCGANELRWPLKDSSSYELVLIECFGESGLI